MEAESVLSRTPYGALATVNEDGSPWVVPVHVFLDEGALYWMSADETQHSQNLIKNDRVSFTTWITPEGEKSQGLYVNGPAKKLDKPQTLEIQAKMTDKLGKTPPIFDTTYAYRLPIGELNRDKSSENRWYFYT